MKSELNITKDADIFTLDQDPLAFRGKMSCGHAVLPQSLEQYVQMELDAKKTVIKCPHVDSQDPSLRCNKIWYFFK